MVIEQEDTDLITGDIGLGEQGEHGSLRKGQPAFETLRSAGVQQEEDGGVLPVVVPLQTDILVSDQDKGTLLFVFFPLISAKILPWSSMAKGGCKVDLSRFFGQSISSAPSSSTDKFPG
ncbi:hypothetical protein [Filifactor villosus]|uniref:Uncharacterized protein n=1 Tax=Filifactor villosus TaxID=29374 RepID=A0ABV9QID7_9FIRM